MMVVCYATYASVEWDFAKQVKLAGHETFVQEVTDAGRLLARSRRCTHGDPRNTSFPIELGKAIDLMYTTGLPRDIPSHRNRGGTCRVAYTELFDNSGDKARGDLSRVRSQRRSP